MRFATTLKALAATAFVASQAFAVEDLKCEITGAVKCLCPASMLVNCGKVSGYVNNEEPVKSVTISYRAENGQKGTIVLTNPKGKARDFYAAHYNDEVKAALRKKGIDPEKADASGQSITIAGSATIYADPDKKGVASGGGGGGSSTELSNCSWTAKPQVIQAKGCGSALCIGTVSCNGGEGPVACKAKSDGKSCGSAQTCAEDPDASPVDSQNVQFEGTIKSGSSSGNSAQ